MKKNKSNSIEDFLTNPNNQYPITYQNITVQNLKKMIREYPHLKMIEIDELGTLTYPVDCPFKPISKIFIINACE